MISLTRQSNLKTSNFSRMPIVMDLQLRVLSYFTNQTQLKKEPLTCFNPPVPDPLIESQSYVRKYGAYIVV